MQLLPCLARVRALPSSPRTSHCLVNWRTTMMVLNRTPTLTANCLGGPAPQMGPVFTPSLGNTRSIAAAVSMASEPRGEMPAPACGVGERGGLEERG